MKAEKSKNTLQRFLGSSKEYPVLAAVAAGMYPMIFYYTNNFELVNSWQHLGYFTIFFLLVPILVFVFAHRISVHPFIGKWGKYIIPFLNIFTFLFLMKVCLYASIQKKIALGIFFLAAILAFFLYKHLKKWMIVQLLLAGVGLITFLPVIYQNLTVSKEWMIQPDDIEHAIFKKKPNIYYIQPDGYVNFSELDKGYYQYDNSEFEMFLEGEGFKNYPGFRNNYASTLSSNSANFMMKHHYYNQSTDFGETSYARKTIMTDNLFVKILKNNGYKTHFIGESYYLMMNRPNLTFDFSNIEYKDVPYLSSGFKNTLEILPPIKQFMAESSTSPKFYFIEFFKPGHISNSKTSNLGKEKEKKLWIENLELANNRLKNIISEIKSQDPEALILIMADHGGFVGMDYSRQSYIKTNDRDKIYSIFSSILTIHWPNHEIPVIDENLKSAVNVFRILISHLSENPDYLQHLQKDSSYMMIKEGAPTGIYEYIDGNGNVTFKKH